MSLSSLIVQREIATIRQVEEALARQVLYGGDLVTNLLEVAKLDEGTLTTLLAESLGMPHATLGPLPMPSERARGLVTSELATSRAVVPLAVEDGAIVVAVAEPLPKEVEDELTFALGLRVVQRIAPMVRVRELLARVYGAPLERRLQRLLARLGAAPSEQPAPRPPSAPPPAPPSPAAGPASERTRPDAVAPVPPPPEAPAPRPPSARPPAPATPATPARHEQRDSSAPRAQRRRRGPLVPSQARKELDESADRDAILDLFFDYARQYFDYSVLFVVHNEIAEGRDAFGDGASRDRVQAVGVPLDIPSVLAAARDAGGAVRVAPADDGLDAVLLGDLERRTRAEVLVVPVIVRTRCVAIFYGDSGDVGVDEETSRDVSSFGLLVGQAFEKLIVRKKLRGHMAGQAPAPSPSARPAPAESVPPKHGSPVSERAASQPAPPVVEPVHVQVPIQVGPEPLPEPPPPPPSPAPPPASPPPASPPEPALPVFRVELPVGTPTPPPSARSAHPSDLPPPPNAFVLRRPNGPPIPREEPEAPPFPSPEPPPPPPPSAVPDSAPPSASFAVAPHRPPLSRMGSSPSLPSVIVDVDEGCGALVDLVISNGRDEAAEAELLRRGNEALTAIMSRFPGPTVVDRARVEDGSLRASECGPVLRLIVEQRRAIVPYLLPLLGDGNPVRRYWATFLITELTYPEAVDPLVPRLFDPDVSVRKVARLAARAISGLAPEALMERLMRYYRDPALSDERRVEMIETLGELRERLAVPLLIDALEDEHEEVAAAARRALMTVTRQDLGRDPKKWQLWWAQNAGRHRVEWLIDALMHEVPALRRAAGDELKALTKEYFGYYDDLPRKEREKAQLKYREWWAGEGRARHQRR